VLFFVLDRNVSTLISLTSADLVSVFNQIIGNGIFIKNDKNVARILEDRIKSKILDIKFDKQDYILSCEVATLKMAFAYKGLKIEEDELFRKLPIDDKPPLFEDDGTIRWSDPNQVFVGNRNGKMFQDGYGVHWRPIAKLARNYRDAGAFSDWTIEDIRAEIDDNNPVIIWGYYGPGETHKWYTWEGRRVDAVKFEHTFLVHGYETVDGQIKFINVIDPNRGKMKLGVDDFKLLWSFYNNSGVVIY